MNRVCYGLSLLALSITVAADPGQSDPSNSVPRQASYEAVNCQGAPDAAVIKVPSPAGSYALIFCSPQGHMVAPVDGFIWFPVNRLGQPFMFNAATKNPADRPKRAYFTQVASRALSGDALEKSNKMLEQGYQLAQKFTEVAQLDIASADGLIYNIFFYIDRNRPVFVLGCLNQCNTSVLLREYSFAEAKAVVSK